MDNRYTFKTIKDIMSNLRVVITLLLVAVLCVPVTATYPSQVTNEPEFIHIVNEEPDPDYDPVGPYLNDSDSCSNTVTFDVYNTDELVEPVGEFEPVSELLSRTPWNSWKKDGYWMIAAQNDICWCPTDEMYVNGVKIGDIDNCLIYVPNNETEVVVEFKSKAWFTSFITGHYTAHVNLRERPKDNRPWMLYAWGSIWFADMNGNYPYKRFDVTKFRLHAFTPGKRYENHGVFSYTNMYFDYNKDGKPKNTYTIPK
jgi:hypothetical protein